MRPSLEFIPLRGIPEVREGDDVAGMIGAAAASQSSPLVDGDIVVVKQKIISKSEGRVVRLDEVSPGRRALSLAQRQGKDPRLVQLILDESKRVVREGHGVIITETLHGFVCANAGIDRSNVPKGCVSLLPADPDASARRIRKRLERATGKTLAVIITDTFGRPWRKGQTDVAIGVAGMHPLLSYRGKVDRFGYELRVTEPAVADEVAGAAELASEKLSDVPVVIARGVNYRPGAGRVTELLMEPDKDLFR